MSFKILLWFAFFSVALAPVLPAQNKTNLDSDSLRTIKLEIKILDTISHLREVKQRNAYVIKHSKHQRQLKYIIWSKPSNSEPFYWVKVVEDNGIADYTHFNFFVYPYTLTIKYFDTNDDKEIDLKTWRRKMNK